MTAGVGVQCELPGCRCSEWPRFMLTWLCQRCEEPINDGDGYLHVSHTEIRHVLRLQVYDQPALWMVHHRGCDPRPMSDDYWIDVAHVHTWHDVLDRHLHLQRKKWLPATDWPSVIYNAVADTAPPW